MKLDPAIARALSLDPARCTLAAHGGSGFATTGKISVTESDEQFFLKTSSSPGAATMFAGEHESLNALHAVPSLCPRSLAHGPLDAGGSFLVTEFLDMRGTGGSRGSGMSLAAKLARLHTMPAPVPRGYAKAQFGFPVPTCCGDTTQENEYSESWASFFATSRLRAILRQAEASNGRDSALHVLVERVAQEVVPRLLGDQHLNGGKGIMPVVVHGDLWSGNHGRGIVGRQDGVEEVVFDPSACYAHNEYELGIMHMFGGFGGTFLREYHALCPKTEPVDEYDDRVALYESYHHLNHYAIFGGSYKSGATSILQRLLAKHGD